MPQPLDPRFIDVAQEKLAVLFPAAYRALMALQNGGLAETDEAVFELFFIQDATSAATLADTWDDMARETIVARAKENFPADGVVIGRDPETRDLLLLLPDKHDARKLAPKVHAWHEESGEKRGLLKNLAALRWSQ